jgi:glycosyltransferase involved in cell wall biosynthesis
VAEPAVTVCVPSYNGSRHIDECLDSVAAQTFADLEVLVVDDASTDGTPELAERHRKNDPRVRIERNPRNLGLVQNWNRCVALARGRWLKFVFQDDVIAPTCVEALMRAQRPDCPLVVCRRALQFDDGRDVTRAEYALAQEHSLDRLFGEVPFIPAADVRAAVLDLPGINFVGEPTATLVRRDAFDGFGRFNDLLVALCDFEYWARVGSNTGLAYVPEILATFRVHEGSASEVNRTARLFHKDWLDPLVLRCELATAPAYASVRDLAARRGLDLRGGALELAARARRRAEQARRAPGPPDLVPVRAWRDVVRRYPFLARSPRLRALELRYAVGRTVRRRAAPPPRPPVDPTASAVRVVAFYLPQFHPIPENDGWWGRGFTEWRNVVTAEPQFAGHEQPHLPADLGLYDLRVPEVRLAQADLAREAGISAFCWYHYWFEGRRLLERPFAEVLASGEPDLPFCLCWANERWTRAWDGRDSTVLVEQTYSPDDDRAHARWLARVFADERYLRVDGRPVFLVYRAASLPDARRTTDTLRDAAQRAGVGELLLCRVESFRDEHGDPRALGFDAAVEHQPDWTELGRARRRTLPWRVAARAGLSSRAYTQHRIYDYGAMAQHMATRPQPGYRRFPGLTPSWDNTPRRARGGVVLSGSTPDAYERWLEACIARARAAGTELVFVNAWNEWGEGNHLEPDARFGRAYLDATRRAVERTRVGGDT